MIFLKAQNLHHATGPDARCGNNWMG